MRVQKFQWPSWGTVRHHSLFSLSGFSHYLKSPLWTRFSVRFGMQWVDVSLHSLHRDCGQVKGCVVVGVHLRFPIEGTAFILGNEQAGAKVLLTEVTSVPLPEQSGELQQKYPGVFAVCVLTHTMAGREMGLSFWGGGWGWFIWQFFEQSW